MAKQTNPVLILMESIKKDRELLIEKSDILEKAKDEKNEIVSRLKEYRKDVAHMWKYMSEEQQQEIEELGFGSSSASSGGRNTLNPVSEIAVDVLMNAEKHQLTNGELYNGYVDQVPKGEDAETYTEFNIKIRQLYNSGRISKKQLNTKASRDDIITLHVDSQSKK